MKYPFDVSKLPFNPFYDDGEFRPDEQIGRRFWDVYVTGVAKAHSYTGPLDNPGFLAQLRVGIQQSEARSAKNVYLEKATKKAATGDYETAGRLIREAMVAEATAEAHARLAARFGPIVAKEQQRRSAGGKARAKAKAAEHDDIADRYDALILVTKKHKIAGIIAGERGVDVSTVRKALKKTGRC